MSVTIDALTWGDDPTNPPCVVTPETGERCGIVGTPYGDLLFANVDGDHASMAAQLGARTREEAKLGPVPTFANHLEHLFANSPLRRASRVLDGALNGTIARRLKRAFPPSMRQAIQAYAQVTEIDEEQIWRAHLMPELFLWVVGTFHRVMGTSRAHGLGAAPVFGCTSAIALPPHTQRLMHARNFDYFGIESWDRFPSVIFYHPDDGLDFVSIAAAGILGAAATCMNSAGLTLAIHQHMPDEFDLDGVPVGIATDFVMRRARTIEEAVRILRSYPPVGGWTYVLTEGDSGRAAVYEVAPGVENLTWMSDQGRLGYANLYWGEALRDIEVDYYPEYRRCNHARQERVVQCLSQLPEDSGPVQLAQILGDLEDPRTGKARLMGPTIVSVLTVASVVFDPERRRVWVAAGRSPTCRGWYVPFALDDGSGRGGPAFDDEPFIPFPGWHETPGGRAFEYYRQAAAQQFAGESNDDRLLVLIEHSLALAPDEPYLRVLAGLVALRLGRGRRAEGAFRRALPDIDRADRRAEVGLFLAWSLDLQRQRGAAKHLYRSVIADGNADEIVRSRARYARLFRFNSQQASKLNIDFTYGGVP